MASQYRCKVSRDLSVFITRILEKGIRCHSRYGNHYIVWGFKDELLDGTAKLNAGLVADSMTHSCQRDRRRVIGYMKPKLKGTVRKLMVGFDRVLAFTCLPPCFRVGI
jgi:hypothetical protein